MKKTMKILGIGAAVMMISMLVIPTIMTRTAITETKIEQKEVKLIPTGVLGHALEHLGLHLGLHYLFSKYLRPSQPRDDWQYFGSLGYGDGLFPYPPQEWEPDDDMQWSDRDVCPDGQFNGESIHPGMD